MKIIALAHYYLPENRAGAELMLHAMLSELVTAGHEVDVVVTLGSGEPSNIDGVNVFPGAKWESLLRERGRYNVGVTHLMEADKLHAWGLAMKTPVVQLVHNTNRQTETSLARGWPLLVFNSHWIAKHFRRWSSKPVVVHPPVDPGEFRTTPGGHVTLVNMIPEKGSELFYKLAKLLPDVPFLAVEGGYLQHAQVREDLPNVTWQPNTANMRDDVYARTKVLLVPSSYESYGMVGVEAAASGIPAVAHPTEGLLESLGNAGTFIDRSFADSWAIHISQLFTDNAYYADQSDKMRSLSEHRNRERAEQLREWVKKVEAFG